MNGPHGRTSASPSRTTKPAKPAPICGRSRSVAVIARQPQQETAAQRDARLKGEDFSLHMRRLELREASRQAPTRRKPERKRTRLPLRRLSRRHTRTPRRARWILALSQTAEMRLEPIGFAACCARSRHGTARVSAPVWLHLIGLGGAGQRQAARARRARRCTPPRSRTASSSLWASCSRQGTHSSCRHSSRYSACCRAYCEPSRPLQTAPPSADSVAVWPLCSRVCPSSSCSLTRRPKSPSAPPSSQRSLAHLRRRKPPQARCHPSGCSRLVRPPIRSDQITSHAEIAAHDEPPLARTRAALRATPRAKHSSGRRTNRPTPPLRAQVWIAPTALSSAEVDGYMVLSNTAAGLIARTDMCACADEPLTRPTARSCAAVPD